MNKLPFFLFLLLTVGCLTACSNVQSAAVTDEPETALQTPDDESAGKAENTITVNSSEEVRVVPDIAEIIYSVRTQSSAASSCQQENTESVSQVIALLTGLGVSETSIQTSGYYMNPVYDYSGRTARITGYEAVTSLTVSDLSIDSLDEILAASVDGGVNSIQSISYKASKYDESYQEALRAAVASAYEKAQVLAAASGCQVSSVVSITETSGYTEERYHDRALANKQQAYIEESLSDLSSSISPGEIQVAAAIIIEYALR